MSEANEEQRSSFVEDIILRLLCYEMADDWINGLQGFDEVVPVFAEQPTPGWAMPVLPWNAVVGPVNVSVVSRDVDGGPALMFSSVKTLDPRRLRPLGVYRRFAVHSTVAAVYPDGKCTGHDTWVLSNNGVDWFRMLGDQASDMRPKDRIIRLSDEEKQRYFRNLMVIPGLEWNKRNRWRALLSAGTGPSVSIETDPGGILEMFRLRDVPFGRKRRPALRHWVEKHWRRTTEGVTATEVKKHLRGATEFNWQGLKCKVSIPEDPLAADLRMSNLIQNGRTLEAPAEPGGVSDQEMMRRMFDEAERCRKGEAVPGWRLESEGSTP